jgi:hypothetical protein
VKRSWFAVLVCAFVSISAAAQGMSSPDAATGAPVAVKGKMLVAANGARLGTVYRVGPDGSAQLIIDGKMVTVPASTLSITDGKLTTSLTKSEVLALH